MAALRRLTHPATLPPTPPTSPNAVYAENFAESVVVNILRITSKIFRATLTLC